MGAYQEKLTVKLDPDLMVEVYRLLHAGGYKTVSELVRTALRHFISEETKKQAPNTLIITLPRHLNDQLDMAVSKEFIGDKERFVEEAVRNYLAQSVERAMAVDSYLNGIMFPEEEEIEEEESNGD